MKRLFCPGEHLKGTKEHETVEKPWTSIGGFLTRFWMFSTNDACTSKVERERPSSHKGAGAWRLDLSLKTKVSVGSKNASKVVQTTMEAQTMKRLFCPIKHLKGPKEQETVEKGNAFNDSNVMFYWFLMVCRSFQGILSTGRLWGTTTWYWRCSTLLPANGSTCGIGLGPSATAPYRLLLMSCLSSIPWPRRLRSYGLGDG